MYISPNFLCHISDIFSVLRLFSTYICHETSISALSTFSWKCKSVSLFTRQLCIKMNILTLTSFFWKYKPFFGCEMSYGNSNSHHFIKVWTKNFWVRNCLGLISEQKISDAIADWKNHPGEADQGLWSGIHGNPESQQYELLLKICTVTIIQYTNTVRDSIWYEWKKVEFIKKDQDHISLFCSSPKLSVLYSIYNLVINLNI